MHALAGFISVLHLADTLFDGKPFSLRLTDAEYRPLAGIYDGVMVALDEVLEHRDTLIAKRSAVQHKFAEVVSAQGYRGALTGVASTASDIKGRIAVFRKLFAEHV